MALEHRTVATNGIHLHCAVDGDGPLVVLLHGFPECWYSWRHQIAALAPRFRAVAPDLRGYNLSDKPAGVAAYALPELVADVRGLVEAFGEREAVIVGHDWGGAVAWTFAMEHPEATRRLVVMNCPHPAIFAQHLGTNRRQLARSWYMFFFQLPWLPETLLGLGHARLIADAIRRTAVRQDSLTEEDLLYLRAAAAVAAPVPVRRPADRGPARAARGLAQDHRAHAAGLGRAGRRARQGAVARHGAAHRRAVRGEVHPALGPLGAAGAAPGRERLPARLPGRPGAGARQRGNMTGGGNGPYAGRRQHDAPPG